MRGTRTVNVPVLLKAEELGRPFGIAQRERSCPIQRDSTAERLVRNISSYGSMDNRKVMRELSRHARALHCCSVSHVAWTRRESYHEGKWIRILALGLDLLTWQAL